MRSMQGSTVLSASSTVFGVALNFHGLLAQRLDEFQQPPYQKPPQTPVLFIKTPNTLNHDGGQVAQPRGERLQPGPALGVVIGRDVSRVKAADVLDHIAGYIIANEFSLPEDSYYRPAVKAKCRDGFCALGALVPVGEVLDSSQLGIRLRVNGEVRQTGSHYRIHDSARRRCTADRHPSGAGGCAAR